MSAEALPSHVQAQRTPPCSTSPPAALCPPELLELEADDGDGRPKSGGRCTADAFLAPAHSARDLACALMSSKPGHNVWPAWHELHSASQYLAQCLFTLESVSPLIRSSVQHCARTALCIDHSVDSFNAHRRSSLVLEPKK